MPQSIASACTGLKLDLIFFIEAFLWIAFIIALLGALADIISKVIALFKRQTPVNAQESIDADPVKFIDALKGLIDTLARAPAWMAMFLAAMALLWATSAAMPEYCNAPAPSRPNAVQSGQTGPSDQTATPPAGNGQAPAARP